MAQPSAWPKPIVFTLNMLPNYLWHMLAVARIGYDSNYAETYRDSLSPEDLELLEQYRETLIFGEGTGGDLSGLFTVLPSWLRIDDREEYERFFETLDVVLRQGGLEPFVKAFPEADWTDPFFVQFLNQGSLHPGSEDMSRIAAVLGDIYLRNLDSYRNDIWPEARAAMEHRAAELNAYFAETDYIARWERFLGMPFATERYEIMLCYANRNGPDYNSIGYSGNLFYYDKPFDRTWQFASHEIGTHLLIDLYFTLAGTNRYDHAELYAAYECLAMFYNRIILDVETLDYTIPQMNDEHHLMLYGERYADGVAPQDMLEYALGQ